MKLMIINPVAGHGKALALSKEVLPLVKDCESVLTKTPDHATALAREAAEIGKYDAVIALGGDGTVSDVAAGLRGTEIPLGIIPAGTGNDTGRAYRIPSDPRAAAEAINTATSRPVDTLRFNGKVYMNIVSVGFDAQVVKNAARFKRFGSISYAMGVYTTLTGYRSTPLRLTVDGETRALDAFLVAVGCGSHYGGNMKVLPMADPCDGLLDICLMDPVARMTVIKALPKFIKGQHGDFSFTHFSRARHVVMEAAAPGGFDVNADGEFSSGLERVELEVLPRSQYVLMPTP